MNHLKMNVKSDRLLAATNALFPVAQYHPFLVLCKTVICLPAQLTRTMNSMTAARLYFHGNSAAMQQRRYNRIAQHAPIHK
jgi:hypothetical protein